uniref:Suppressor of cytokine signaling 2 n=1 Tax=Zonotrichia albicollis TaxID=44394 RepID=A0A8D2QFM1_ZONAL
MTVAEAKERLQDAPEGTFLVRDSSHSEYLLTISVKTSAGPTNLRIEYQDGKFRLDSITCVRSRLKQFNSVVHLIEYYVLMCKDRTETPSNGTVHLYLNKPLYTSAPSLQHRCRIAINKSTNQIWELPLPTRLKEYLKEYQYQVARWMPETSSFYAPCAWSSAQRCWWMDSLFSISTKKGFSQTVMFKK